jgi:hypothetical protein
LSLCVLIIFLSVLSFIHFFWAQQTSNYEYVHFSWHLLISLTSTLICVLKDKIMLLNLHNYGPQEDMDLKSTVYVSKYTNYVFST